jgi:hypothetical protein
MGSTRLDILSLGRTNTVAKTGPNVFTANNVPAAWSGTTTYAQYNVVEYGTAVYRSKIAGNIGNQPDISPNEWERLYTNLSDGDAVYIFNGAQSGKRMRIGGQWVKLTSDLIGTVTNSMFHWDGTGFTENLGMLLDGYEIRGFDDTAADAVKAVDVRIGGANKTAGTGDGGDLLLEGGTSAGGEPGKVRLGGFGVVVDAVAASDPILPLSEVGQIYYNTTMQKFRYFNGTVWQDLGSGSGGGSGLLEDLKNQLIDSYYNFLSAEDFANTTDLVDSVNTTAVYNLTSRSYHMATGQKLTTINLLDSGFFDFKQDIDQAMVTLRYVEGHVDTNPTVKLTRNSGVTWQTVTVTRNGQTDELSGILNFANETLTQTATYTVTADRTLNTSAQQKLAQILTIPANTLKLVKDFTFDVTKTGSPNGKLIVKLVKENSGNPSLLDSDLISTVEKNMSTISTGSITVNFGNQVLKPGNYYLLFETDSAYQNSFVSGTTELQIRTDTITPDAQAYNGTAWSAIAGESIQYSYTYKDINLKLEVTASTASRLIGFGVLYQKLTELVSPVSYDQIIVGSSAQVSAGLATHSSLQDALNSVGFSKRIKVLAETISENVTLSQNDVVIEGDGRGSVLSGNLTISGNNVSIEKMRITGDVTINGNSNFLDKVWLSVNSSITDNGQNNSITGILE